jgi:threonine synthase
MDFHSTKDSRASASISTAIRQGLAPDGGLYVPERLPELGPEAFEGLEAIEEIAARLMRPFFDGDPLEGELSAICEDTYRFPVPTRRLDDETAVLELFHGPTAAFKDIGAAFLASSLGRLEADAEQNLTILVATSGDTGAAVSAAFDERPGCEVVVLYPKGRVSERQRALLTCWGETVTSVAVRGDFDDCQRIVKEAFADEWWEENRRVSSANSINVGRLIPQVTYYAQASLELWRETGRRPDFVVPTGNAGNVLGCLYARQMGLPIGRIVAATNENRPITHYLQTGRWEAFETEQTLATAMDVGNPSNFERIRHHWPSAESLRDQMTAETASDEQIRTTIRRGPDEWGEIWDPHTACAVTVCEQLDSELAVVVATAHPAKFPNVVEPLVGREVAIPPNMARMLERPTSEVEIAPTLEALTDVVRDR